MPRRLVQRRRQTPMPFTSRRSPIGTRRFLVGSHRVEKGAGASHLRGMTDLAKKRLLVGAAGSMSVTTLPPYLAALHQELASTLTVVMTRSAQRFLPAETVGLLANRVVTGDDPAHWPTG